MNFLNGIPDGGMNYFSLEESINLSQLPTISAVPEPASLSLFAVGLLGLGLPRHRRKA